MTKPSASIEYLQYPNIYVERTVSIGKRLVILAEADEGNFYDPVLIYNKDMATTFFGGGKLVACYEDAVTYMDNLNIFLMRIEPNGYETAFSVLESFTFDLLFIHELHFNTQRETIDSFLDFAKRKEQKGSLIHGITTLPNGLAYSDLEGLFPQIAELSIDNGDDTIETGKYLSVVVSQMDLKDAGAVYAGILTAVDPATSPINKTIPDVELLFDFEKEEVKALRAAGIVCFRNTFKKGVTCNSSSCAVSTDGSVHKHISNFRIAQFIINQIADELQILIGRPNANIQASHAEEIIDSVCYEHIQLSRIRDFNYSVSSTLVSGIIETEIEVVPIFSIHAMTTHSRVQVYK